MKNILIGKGIDTVLFGITRDDLKTILGEPDEIEKHQQTSSDDSLSETWHYDELEISASFDEADEWKLGSLAVSSNEYCLGDKKLIGVTIDDIEEAISSLNLGELMYEDLSSEGEFDHELVSIEESSIYFWFEEGILTEVSWGPIFSDDETIIWPN